MYFAQSNLATAFVILAVIILILKVGADSSYEDEITLTAQEKAALDKFKTLVIPKIPANSYIQKYKNDDLYFIRWVRARSLDVTAAERSFLNHLKWREEQRMDTILNEDWSDFEKELPIFVDTVDKAGRPTIEAFMTDLNTRQATLTGKSRKIVRWMARNLELFSRRIYAARADGKEISQGVFICNAEGFNLIRHACPACLPLYASLLIMYANHYPGTMRDAFVMDTPPTFQIVLNMVKAIVPDVAKILKVYTNKEEGFKALDQRYDKDQRSVRFGGILTRGLTEHLD